MSLLCLTLFDDRLLYVDLIVLASYCILIHRYNTFLDCAIIQLSELLRHRQSQIDAHMNNGAVIVSEDIGGDEM